MHNAIATHLRPVWAAEADFLIMAVLPDPPLEGKWEQLWTQRVSEDEFRVCCIPFFIYGIALGDVVRTTPQNGKKFVIEQVTQRSGRGVLRFWTKHARPEHIARLHAVINQSCYLAESYGEHLLAIDLNSDGPHPDLDELCSQSVDLGIIFERGA